MAGFQPPINGRFWVPTEARRHGSAPEGDQPTVHASGLTPEDEAVRYFVGDAVATSWERWQGRMREYRAAFGTQH